MLRDINAHYRFYSAYEKCHNIVPIRLVRELHINATIKRTVVLLSYSYA